MSATLIPSALSSPAAFLNGSCSQPRVSKKASRVSTMCHVLRARPLMMQGFTGLWQSSTLDFQPMRGRGFNSMVTISISAPRGRGSRGVPRAMFERFTEKGIKVILVAQEEARRLGHNYIGTEQMLLGLIGGGTGIAAKVLKSMRFSLKDARWEVESLISRGSGYVATEIPFVPRSKRILELTLEEACKLGHSYIGTEHLLLGLLREGKGIASQVLENLGVGPNNLCTQVIRMVGESTEAVNAGVKGGSSMKMPMLEE